MGWHLQAAVLRVNHPGKPSHVMAGRLNLRRAANPSCMPMPVSHAMTTSGHQGLDTHNYSTVVNRRWGYSAGKHRQQPRPDMLQGVHAVISKDLRHAAQDQGASACAPSCTCRSARRR